MEEYTLIELYITLSDFQEIAAVEQLLEAVDLDTLVRQTLQAVGLSDQVMLTLMLTDDEGISEMNTQYRQQSKPTDVLSFPLSNQPLVDAPAELLWQPQENEEPVPDFVTPPGMVTNLGDIVMSWPTLQKQAAQAQHSSLYELLFLFVHGILHLVGYDDQSEAGYTEMVRIQHMVLEANGQKA